MRECEISVGFDSAAKPRNCFLVLPNMQLGRAGAAHPVMSCDIARAEAQRLDVEALRLLGPPEAGLRHADQRKSIDEVAIQHQRMLEFGNAFGSAIDVAVDRAKPE